MKKISRMDLQGLRKNYRVLTQVEMGHAIGGYTVDEIQDYLLYYLGNSGYGFSDSDGNFHWYKNDHYDSNSYLENPYMYSEWLYGAFLYESMYSHSNYYAGACHADNKHYGEGQSMTINGTTYDLKGSCVFDSLSAMMSQLKNRDLNEGEMRKEYFDYLVQSGDKDPLNKALNPVTASELRGYMEYLGFSVKGYDQNQLIDGSVKGGDIKKAHGIAIVGIEDPKDKHIDFHAITVTSIVRTENGDPLYFTFDDKQNLVQVPGNKLLPQHLSYYFQLQ